MYSGNACDSTVPTGAAKSTKMSRFGLCLAVDSIAHACLSVARNEIGVFRFYLLSSHLDKHKKSIPRIQTHNSCAVA